MIPPQAKSSTESDERQVVDSLVLAFDVDPVVRWIYTDAHQYLINFPDFVRGFGGRAFEQGTAYHIDEFLGAALWLPPDVHPDEDTLVPFLQRTVPERLLEDLFSIFDQMAGFHPSERHWYLPLIGVDPAYQGKGLGSALLEHVLIPCDRNNEVAYLESTNPRNISLYERYGFEVLGTIQVGTAPPLYPMLRKPR